jgi:hypothetical protein
MSATDRSRASAVDQPATSTALQPLLARLASSDVRCVGINIVDITGGHAQPQRTSSRSEGERRETHTGLVGSGDRFPRHGLLRTSGARNRIESCFLADLRIGIRLRIGLRQPADAAHLDPPIIGRWKSAVHRVRRGLVGFRPGAHPVRLNRKGEGRSREAGQGHRVVITRRRRSPRPNSRNGSVQSSIANRLPPLAASCDRRVGDCQGRRRLRGARVRAVAHQPNRPLIGRHDDPRAARQRQPSGRSKHRGRWWLAVVRRRFADLSAQSTPPHN